MEPLIDSHDDGVVTPRFPVICPHGHHVGWALRNEPTRITDMRYCTECPDCSQGVDHDDSSTRHA